MFWGSPFFFFDPDCESDIDAPLKTSTNTEMFKEAEEKSHLYTRGCDCLTVTCVPVPGSREAPLTLTSWLLFGLVDVWHTDLSLYWTLGSSAEGAALIFVFLKSRVM